MQADPLADDFRNPPPANQIRCYWYWYKGNVSKEGITKDLEAMKRIGIGEAYIGVIEGGPVKSLTDEWWQMQEHAIREGGRIGVDIGMFNSPGWSQSGGPWVKPEQSMRYVVLPEKRIRGPVAFSEKLPIAHGEFQDLSVLAFPAPAQDADTAESQGAVITRTPADVTYAMPKPFTARSLTVKSNGAINGNATLEVSDDGVTYRPLRKFVVNRSNLGLGVGPVPLAPVAISFPATKAAFFRVSFSGKGTLDDLTLSAAPRVQSLAEKSLIKMFQSPHPPFDYYRWPLAEEVDTPSLVIDPAKVLNLSSKMAADGTLSWNVPEGDWIVLRAGLLPTGTKNGPAPAEATGYEVDKMNRQALKAHFDAYVGKLLVRMPAEERKALKHVVADSYEVGPQNWTDGLQADFKNKYGYDPLPFLPVMTGRIVGSSAQSDRFLWDLRRLVADRISTEYVGGLRDLCNANGLKMWLENYGHWGFPGEFLQYGGNCDEIGGEFWVDGALGTVELRPASSAAHIYGKKQVFAESFTGGKAFQDTPWSLKKRGDWAFCQGINQTVLHVYLHQPWDDRLPGVNAWFGTEFNRHNTWFDASKTWMDYLRRCSVMLQGGLQVADVAYFIGEDAPRAFGARNPELPSGYDFDYINAEVLMTRAKPIDGRLVLPDGMSYKVLVLPDQDTMTPEVLAKIGSFAKAGVTVCGPRPVRSPSLANFPNCDRQVEKLAAELWDKGVISPSKDLKELLDHCQTPPDFAGVDFGKILFTHRRSADADIYFLSNQTDEAVDLLPAFRVTGRAPELWYPDTGTSERLRSYEVGATSTRVPLRLDARGSVFVVFRGQAIANNKIEAPAATKPATQTIIDSPWNVTFPGLPAPVPFAQLTSWTEQPDPVVKYFSGTATYRTAFTSPADLAKKSAFLDLGGVESFAEVTLNGHTFGWLWKPPFRVDVSKVLKAGTNDLEVRVVSTWSNRLLGQKQAPDAFNAPGNFKPWLLVDIKPKKLTPSGLLGPVMLVPNQGINP